MNLAELPLCLAYRLEVTPEDQKLGIHDGQSPYDEDEKHGDYHAAVEVHIIFL